jgi:hypothetical protein
MNAHFFSFLFHPSRPSVSHVNAPERARTWLTPVTTVIFLPGVLAMSSCCPSNSIRKIPTIRGRVVEAKTNKPIAGARLARWFEREDGCLAPGGSDVHSVARSFVIVTSDKDASFEWPAWTGLLSPIRSMQWYVYHPEWVVGSGWFNQPRSGLDGYFFGTTSAEPWVHLVSHPVGSQLEVTITMEPKDSTAAWEAHFQRMQSLTQYGMLDVDDLVKEAVAYAENNPLTEGMLDPLSELTSRMGTRPEKMLLVTRIAGYCDSHPNSATCRHVGPRYVLDVIRRDRVH